MDIGDLTYIKVKENHGDWEQAGKDILYTAIHLVPMVPVILLGVQYFKPKEKRKKWKIGTGWGFLGLGTARTLIAGGIISLSFFNPLEIIYEKITKLRTYVEGALDKNNYVNEIKVDSTKPKYNNLEKTFYMDLGESNRMDD